jgi:ssRNA-specific RNase YbeY (16S rRNA maturation enzyme)
VVGEAWRAPLVHAVLHLVGYDHGAAMEAREREHAE